MAPEPIVGMNPAGYAAVVILLVVRLHATPSVLATLRPFHAIRPTPAAAPLVSAVPYDVVDVDEARALAAGNSLSFLHVSRPEIDLPAGTDPHGDQVYELASLHYGKLRADAPLLRERYPAMPILALTVYDEDARIFEALCAGASGYLLKNTPPERRDTPAPEAAFARFDHHCFLRGPAVQSTDPRTRLWPGRVLGRARS